MRHPDLTRVSRRNIDAKRAFDLLIAGVALAATAPLLGGIAVAVRLESEGPALFRQSRVGRGGTPFRIHKFRTLRTGLAGPLISPSDDPRVTRVGAALRRTKLDELPQLIDVLGGQMSLVGPRPEVASYVAMWPPDARELILSVRPGITDPASIAMRNEAEELARATDPEEHYVTSLLPRKVALYVDYVRHRTFFGDLRLLARTVAVVLRG